MQKVVPHLKMLQDNVRTHSKRRHARWDDAVFEHWVSWQTDYLWRTLEKHAGRARERSILTYLELVAAGIGAGYLASSDGEARTLMEAFLGKMPMWFTSTQPERHAGIAATAWNLAEGARREAQWMEQYLLARAQELDDPMLLEQRTLELLKPVLEPPRDATWQGPFKVTVVEIAPLLQSFLPGELSMLTPSLIRIADRRHPSSVGVLLAPQGKSTCIGRMDGLPALAVSPPPARVPVRWAGDRVTVASTTVALPLMACEPLHTLALASGYLLAVVRNSQRLWVIETP